jgi:hypothetical protein
MQRVLMIAGVLAAFAACKKADKPAPAADPAAATKTADPLATDPAKPATPGPTDGTTPTAPPAAPVAPAGARPASITEADAAFADKLVAAMGDFAKSVSAAGTDCKAAAAAVKASVATLTPLMEQAEEIKTRTEKDPAAKQWFEATYLPKIQTSMMSLMQTAQACEKDKEFMAAIESMPMGKKKTKAPTP